MSFERSQWHRVEHDRYRNDVTGETVSRRQFRNEYYRASGWDSYSEYERVASTKRYKFFSREAITEHDVTRRDVRAPDSEFNQLYLDSLRQDFPTSPRGPFAEFLEYIGLRDDGAEYDVGDSPGATN